jgi:hypothetical protein
MACDGEMKMTTVDQDDVPMSGFEYHTFECSACHDAERRLVFVKTSRGTDVEPAPVHIAPTIVDTPVHDDAVSFMDTPLSTLPSTPPTSSAQDAHATPASFFGRVASTMRGCWSYLQHQATPRIVRPLGG